MYICVVFAQRNRREKKRLELTTSRLASEQAQQQHRREKIAQAVDKNYSAAISTHKDTYVRLPVPTGLQAGKLRQTQSHRLGIDVSAHGVRNSSPQSIQQDSFSMHTDILPLGKLAQVSEVDKRRHTDPPKAVGGKGVTAGTQIGNQQTPAVDNDNDEVDDSSADEVD